MQRIRAYLDDELPTEGHGVVIVACQAQNVFEALPLGVPVANLFLVGPTPHLAGLERLAEDAASYAVLLADQKHAVLTFVSQARPDHAVTLDATGYPRKTQRGGASQRRSAARADERAEAFFTDVAEQTRQALAESDVHRLVLAGDETTVNALRDALHTSVQHLIVGDVRLDIRASESDIIAATLPVVSEAERARELETVQRIQENRGPGGGAAVGAEDVLVALQAGQVMTLVMTDDFHTDGWADFSLPVCGVGATPRAHPAGGDPRRLVPVKLEQEIVRLALQTGADIEIVQSTDPTRSAATDDTPEAGSGVPRTEAARALDQFGGVGALLRFTLTDDQSTAEF